MSDTRRFKIDGAITMQPIRLIIEHVPESIPIPLDMRHQPIEVIIWSLLDQQVGDKPTDNLISGNTFES